MNFEVSSVNLSAMGKALLASGRAGEVYALLSPEARATFENPLSARWHPGAHAIEGWAAIVQVGGMKWLEDLNFELTRKSFGPIVGPLVKIGLTISGSSPATLLSRLGEITSVALRGLAFDWKATGTSAGVLTLRYPLAVPPTVVEGGWRGILRVGGEMTGKAIRVEQFSSSSDHEFRLDLSW